MKGEVQPPPRAAADKSSVMASCHRPLLETPRQVAERAGISEGQVRYLIGSGRLEYVKIGSRLMIPAGAFERFIETEAVKPRRDEIKGQSHAGSKNGTLTTSPGPNTAGAASAALARQIASKLKRSSPNGSSPENADMAPVIPLKFS